MQLNFKITFRNKSIYILIGFFALTIILFALKYTLLGVVSFLYNLYSIAEVKREQKIVPLTPEQAKEFKESLEKNNIQTEWTAKS